jgi:hypothetical protein
LAQVPFAQTSEAEQLLHACPDLPHAAVEVPVWQPPFESQQPLQVVVHNDWHVPFTQDCPLGQDPHGLPQEQETANAPMMIAASARKMSGKLPALTW